MSNSPETKPAAAPAAPPAVIEPKVLKSPISFGTQGAEIKTLEDAYRFSEAIVRSGFAPKGMEKPEAVLVALQLGAELGLTPMSALQNIGVINGRPGIYGDAALALVRGTKLLEQYTQEEVGERGKDTWGFKVTAKRKEQEQPVSETFTVADAKTANLWGKQGPWTQYPKRMLMWRARGFVLRDLFGDVLKGLRTMEELADIPPEPKNVTPAGALQALVDGPTPQPAEPAKIQEAAPAATTASVPVEIMPDKPKGRKAKAEAAATSAPAPVQEPTASTYSEADRKAAIEYIEARILDGGTSEKAVMQDAIQRGLITLDQQSLNLFELPTAILIKIADREFSKP